MTESTSNQRRSISLLRWIGYGLLVLAFFNIIEIFVPFRLLNPAGGIQTLSVLIERVFIPLLGLALVFFGQADYREDWEIPLLKVLSWLCLLVGVLFALLIPMGINNTVQLYASTDAQVAAQSRQQVSQVEEFKARLQKAEGKELELMLTRLNRTGKSVPLNDLQLLNQFRAKFLSETDKGIESLKTGGEAAKKNQKLSLLASSAKVNLGALVCGILFVGVWHLTRWARRLA
ncbi:MAG: HpsJ family protein [Coleofasciculaceae cyanobacterium]